VIAGDPIHACTRQTRAAKNIAAADDHRGLRAEGLHVAQFAGDALDDDRVDAVVGGTEQCLA